MTLDTPMAMSTSKNNLNEMRSNQFKTHTGHCRTSTLILELQHSPRTSTLKLLNLNKPLELTTSNFLIEPSHRTLPFNIHHRNLAKSAGNRRTASVRSVGYSDLFCLSKQVIITFLCSLPQVSFSLSLQLATFEVQNLKKSNSSACFFYCVLSDLLVLLQCLQFLAQGLNFSCLVPY